MPWWAALLIAVSATAIGYAVDAGTGHKDLTHVFAGFYIAGCVVAVLAVRQDGVFTAIIQPPLILFCAVPGAYWMFHGHKLGNLKDLLINCGYPLIERFPLMLGTAGGVLLIGLVRWYFGKSQRAAAGDNAKDAAPEAPEESNSLVSAVGGKLNSFLGLGPREDDAEEAPAAGSKRTRAAGRSPKAAARDGRTTRGSRSGARSSRTHSRHGRPPLDDERDPRDPRDPRDDLAERPRRRRSAPPRDFDPSEPPPRPRRRPRPPGDPDPRVQPPRETRREPRARRDPHDRPPPRSSRFDAYEPYQPPSSPERFDRYESYEPRRRPPAPSGNGNSTHHPISRVRYRGESPLSEPRDEPPAERRGRSRSTRPWEYEG